MQRNANRGTWPKDMAPRPTRDCWWASRQHGGTGLIFELALSYRNTGVTDFIADCRAETCHLDVSPVFIEAYNSLCSQDIGSCYIIGALLALGTNLPCFFADANPLGATGGPVAA
jgi:hypothetical protein